MRVLAIRGKNLASLEGEFIIDFTAEPLRSAGIFAITGQTGSGKSTLLDALCLALFDQTPRNNKSSDGVNIVDIKENTISQTDCRNILRRGVSDGYAEVDFISLGGEPFRSRWSVRRSREKVDGKLQGTVITVHHLKTKVELLGTKTELLRQISELIGLNFDQFTRAVLLAQGDFATFLKAGKNEKADLLEKLTGTDIYSRISASIYEKTKISEQELASLRERIKDIELLSDEEMDRVNIQKQTLSAKLEELKAQIARLTAKMKWISDAEVLNGSVQQARIRLNQVQQAMETAKLRYEYLSQIDSVQEVRDYYSERKNIQRQLTENRVTLSKQETERETNAHLFMQAAAKTASCELEQKQHIKAVAELEPQIRKARELDIRINNTTILLQEAKTNYEQAIQLKLKGEKALKATEVGIKDAVQKLEKIADWFTGHESYKEIVPRVDLIINLLEDATAAKKQGENNAATLTDSKQMHALDIQTLIKLQTEAERLNNLLPTEIATLRAKLVEGFPCLVCGSLHHPVRPVEGESLEEEQLNKAKREVHDQILLFSESIEKRKDENIRLQSIIDGYAKQFREAFGKLALFLKKLPDWESLFAAELLPRSLRKVAENWGICTAEQIKMGEQLATLQASLTFEHTTLADNLQMLFEKEQKLKNCETELEELVILRKGLLSGKNADQVERTNQEKGKELAEQLVQVTVEKNELIARSEKQAGIIVQIKEDFKRLIEQNNKVQILIDNWLTTRIDNITEEQLTELFSKDSHWIVTEREALSRLKEDKTTAQATLEEREKMREKHDESEIKLDTEENSEGFSAQLSSQTLELEQVIAQNAELEVLLVNHFRGKERIQSFEKELEEKSSLSENWKKLNDMFGSADGAKFKVLAQGYTLDALLTYANKHLQELSKRYELQRIPNTLALQVADLDMLGDVRTVHSLSGGESFLISLALALGLSSLSSNRMKVESLFIDEGFGSLDVETLRVAMDALENLRTQGRKIGVISHVAEMTERIPVQIRVIKRVNGRSKIEIR